MEEEEKTGNAWRISYWVFMSVDIHISIDWLTQLFSYSYPLFKLTLDNNKWRHNRPDLIFRHKFSIILYYMYDYLTTTLLIY